MAIRETKGPNYISEDTKNPVLRKELKGLIELAKPQSILTWHITLMFDRIFTIFYCILMTVMHVFKGQGLQYPPSVWGIELSGLIMLMMV